MQKPSMDPPESRPPATQAVRPALRTSFAWLLWSGVFYGLAQWSILIVMTRALSVEDVGTYTLALAISAPIMMFSGLQLRTLQATDSLSIFEFADFYTLRLLLSTASVPVVAMTASLFSRTGHAVLVCTLVAVAKAVESQSDAVHGYFQRHEAIRLIAYSVMLKAALSALVMTVVLILTNSLVIAVTSEVLAFATIFFAFDLRRLRGLPETPRRILVVPWAESRRRIRRLARQGFPLGLSAGASSLRMNVPRYFLQAQAGAAALGFFGAVSYLNIALGRVVLALNNAAAARLSDSFYSNPAQFKRLFWRVVGVIALLGIVAIAVSALFGTELLHIFYGQAYSRYSLAFAISITAAAAGGVASTFELALTVARRLDIQAAAGLAALLTGSLASALLVPKWGVSGGACALAAIHFVHLAIIAGAATIEIRRRGPRPVSLSNGDKNVPEESTAR